MTTTDIPQEKWTRFFDDFSKQHEGWIVNWEVLGSAIGVQEKTNRLPLVGISADKGSKPRIDIIVGGRLNAHITQIIETPKRVSFKPPDQPGHEAIEIETEDGNITVVTFNHIDPEAVDRLLPPKE
jgi:hypothetical protein